MSKKIHGSGYCPGPGAGLTIECLQIGPQICAQRSASQVIYDHDRV